MDPVFVGKCAQIASVLEVSGHPKPGNVHRTQDFSDMVFEDFLISGIAIGKTMEKAAMNGLNLRDDPGKWSDIGLGSLILEAVTETDRWVANNTNLGIIMLLAPICAAAGILDTVGDLRSVIRQIMKLTTATDAVNLYKAINIADAGGMGQQDELDVGSDGSLQKLLDENINMYTVLDMSSQWDSLSHELTHKMPVTFDMGFPLFKKIRAEYGVNKATVQTFLTILSEVPDTLISRKYGEEKARQVSEDAKAILEEGGILTINGQSLVDEFDKKLIENDLNPGTTADFTASSIMIAYLDGYSNYESKFKDITI